MSFVQFLRILWGRRAIVLLATLACLGAALATAAILPKRYDASSRVMMDIVKPDPVTGQVISSQFVRAYTNTQIQLIKDYRVAGQVVDDLGWTSSPERAWQYRESGSTMEFRRWLAHFVSERTHVDLIQGSNILEITFSAANAETARAGADALRKAYVDQTVAFKRQDASKDRAWFERQVRLLRADLSKAQRRLTSFERENGIVLGLDDVDPDLLRLQALAATTPTQYMPAAPVVTGPNPQLAALDAQIAGASKTLGPNHPDLVALREQRAAVARAPTAVIRQVSAPSGPSIASQLSAQTRKVLEQRGKVQEAQQLSSEVATLREGYREALGKMAEFQQLSESTQSGLTPLGNATAPEDPSFPNTPLLVIGATLLGLVIGLLCALIAELLGRRVRGIEDLSQLDFPVLGAMASVARDKRRSRRARGFQAAMPAAAGA